MAAKEDYGTGQKEEQRKPQGEREEEDEAHSRTQERIAQDRSQGRRETDGEEEDRTQRKEEHRQRQEEHRRPQVIRGTSRSGSESSTGGGRAGLWRREG